MVRGHFRWVVKYQKSNILQGVDLTTDAGSLFKVMQQESVCSCERNSVELAYSSHEQTGI